MLGLVLDENPIILLKDVSAKRGGTAIFFPDPLKNTKQRTNKRENVKEVRQK